MKNIIKLAAITTLAVCSAEAAVTFSVANYTGSTFGPNGVPIVNASGVAAPVNTVYASIGYFTTLEISGSSTAASILTGFVPVDNSGVPNATYAGLFNGQDYSSATNIYPAGFQGKQGYIVVGNAQDVKTSTQIAVFSLGTNFSAPAGDNTASYTIQLTSSTASLLFGNVVAVTAEGQPRVDTNDTNNYVNGVQLISSSAAVPETSTSLLGALGALMLLRRRRN